MVVWSKVMTGQSPAFCAQGEVRELVCMVFAGSALYLDAARASAVRTSSGGNAELQPAQAAQVCSCATRRRHYLVSHRLECVVVLSAEKSVELR